MIRLSDVHHRYGPTVALAGLSLDVRAGEMIGLLGPNGAGKSTAMHVLSGLIRPDRGVVEIDGAAPSDPRVRRRIGLAPQSLSVYEQLTGRENLEFFGRLYGLAGAALAARVDAALAFVRLADRQHDRAGGYSGGMQRRLNIAAAIVHEPDVILLDEPTAGVDPQSRNAIFDNVLALKASGRTLVYTTHYMEEAARLCDRIAIVDHGRVLAHGTLEQLLAAHGGPSTLVAKLADGRDVREGVADPLARLNALAREASVVEFHLERPTLEQVFLTLTGRSLRD